MNTDKKKGRAHHFFRSAFIGVYLWPNLRIEERGLKAHSHIRKEMGGGAGTGFGAELIWATDGHG
jgi:hypothetical protein